MGLEESLLYLITAAGVLAVVQQVSNFFRNLKDSETTFKSLYSLSVWYRNQDPFVRQVVYLIAAILVPIIIRALVHVLGYDPVDDPTEVMVFIGFIFVALEKADYTYHNR